jgi:N-hydroxyarylamine O-acetyltransferase
MSDHTSPVRPDPTVDVAGYLTRLGLERPERPEASWLFAAHRAHMERVPYENLEIQLERPTSVDPAESIARIARGRGGYCFHLNGAFGTLLACLGYQVTRHLGQVHLAGTDRDDSPDLVVNHQVLTVRCDDEEWFVDCGLGDAPYEPIPLRAGESSESVQGPFTYRLEPWTARPGGWRFVHDPRACSFPSMTFAPEPVQPAAFAEAHRRLSGEPDSNFVKALMVSRRDAQAIEVLRGRVFTRIDAAGPAKLVIDSHDAWFTLLTDVFGLRLAEIDPPARDRLWARVSAAHERWLAEQQATEAQRPAGRPAETQVATGTQAGHGDDMLAPAG